MTYINLRGVSLTPEMKMWINRSLSSKWHLGDLDPGDNLWKRAKERLGVWLDDEDAIIFKLKFGV